MPHPVHTRALRWEIDEFTAADYATLCGAYLPVDLAVRLDFEEIHRFSPRLTGHRLRKAGEWLRETPGLDTTAFIEYLKDQGSNVRIDEVEPIDWHTLKGAEDVVRALEAKIALPFENDTLAKELGLKPKRGVLLAGPPGTGKTTIGRALAHRLKSKFFLIDGTVVAGSDDFLCTVEKIFEEAERNAPAVVFIDDADVIFDENKEPGFYRYLLTKLDGMESATAGRVCVMLTAMDPSSLPAALVRSGRVELWLETRVPDEEAREAILRDRIAGLPAPLGSADAALLAAASRGLTPADLRSAVEDAKLLYAHDVVSGVCVRPVEEYFLEAIETIRGNGRRHSQRKPTRMAGAVKVGFTMQEQEE